MSLKRMMLRMTGPTGLAALARAATAGQLRILGYHGLWVTPGPVPGRHLFMSPDLFEQRMARLAASGLPVLGLEEAVALLGARRLPANAVVITIDDGWWSTWTHMLPILEHHRLPATLYATTWYADRGLPVVNVAINAMCELGGAADVDRRALFRTIDALPEDRRLDALRGIGRLLGVAEDWLETRQFDLMGRAELADAKARGLDIQLHTHRHIDVTRQIDELPREVAENRAVLTEALGDPDIAHFCYPSGSCHPEAPALLKAAGVRSATLVDEGLNAPDADPLLLRRFLDGDPVSDVEFDAYLAGTLHYLSAARAIVARRAA